MKSGIFTILKKELARFFGDKRMAFSTILFPGLLIYIMYTFMGSALTNMFSTEDAYVYTAALVNPAYCVEAPAEGVFTFTAIEKSEIGDAKNQLAQQELDLCVVLPENFEQAAAEYDISSGATAPQVEVYYNSASPESQEAYNIMLDILANYEAGLANRFDVNVGGSYDMATDRDMAGSIFSAMMPMLLMIFLFSGCMAVAPESIAGEKERGTIATMLVTPTRRSDIAIGKIIALAIIALLSGVSSALGTILSLPKLMGGAAEQISANFYTASDYMLLAVIILSTVLLLITLISVISALAKTVKEAQGYVTPLMIVVMFIGITAMFGSGPQESAVCYLIPLYNSVQCMIGIFSFALVPTNILVTVLSNLVYTGLGVFLLTRLFNSEKIVFSK